MKQWKKTDREMFLQYIDVMRQVRDADFGLSKHMYEIDVYEREHYKKELERQKSLINDYLDIVKFVIKLSATAFIASFAPIDNFAGRWAVFCISIALLALGTGGMIALLKQRSKVEENYIDDMNNMQSSAQDYRDAVLASSNLLKREIEVISEMIRKEAEAQTVHEKTSSD